MGLLPLFINAYKQFSAFQIASERRDPTLVRSTIDFKPDRLILNPSSLIATTFPQHSLAVPIKPQRQWHYEPADENQSAPRLPLLTLSRIASQINSPTTSIEQPAEISDDEDLPDLIPLPKPKKVRFDLANINKIPAPFPKANKNDLQPPSTQSITHTPEASKKYKDVLEEKFGKSLVAEYLDKYFSSYPQEIVNNDELIFKTLGRILRRIVNLENASLRYGSTIEIEKNRTELNFCLKELSQLTGPDPTTWAKMLQIYDRLGLIDTIHSKTSELNQLRLEKQTLYRLPATDKAATPNLLRKIGFIATTIGRLFSQIILRQTPWNEIKIQPIPSQGRLLLGSLPNTLISDHKSLQKEGIGTVLSITEIFENENCGLSRPYSSSSWAEKGITHGWIEAKDHHRLNFEQLHAAADFIHAQLTKGNVYVHCRAGVSRSNQAIAAYLMKYRGCSSLEAARLIKESRPQSKIYNKLKWLSAFEAKLPDRLIRKLQDRLQTQQQVLEPENKELEWFTALSDEQTDLSQLQARHLTTLPKKPNDSTETNCLQIRMGSFIYFLVQEQRIASQEQEIPSLYEKLPIDRSSTNEAPWVSPSPKFLQLLRQASKHYVMKQLDAEIGRYEFKFIEETETKVFKKKQEKNLLLQKIQHLTLKNSAAESLLQLLLTQTGLKGATEITTLIEDPEDPNSRVLSLSNANHGQFIISKRADHIQIIAPMLITIINPKSSSVSTEGPVEVIHTIDMQDPHQPKLATAIKFLPT